MRILELHCDSAKYAAREKAIQGAEPIPPEEMNEHAFENVLVVFTSVEAGDNDAIIERAAAEVKKNYSEVKAKTLLLYPYAHLSSNLAKPGEAVAVLSKFLHKVREFAPTAQKSPFGWYKSFTVACKGHPLSELSKTINADTLAGLQKIKGAANVVEEKQIVLEKVPTQKPAVEEVVSASLKAESVMKTYFRILTPDGKLHKPEEFDYAHHPDLKKFADYEIKKVRAYAQEPPHIKLMKEHGLVAYEPASDSGHFRWMPKGLVIKKLLERHVSNLMVDYGALQVETPIMYDYEHPALKKYLNRFPARQYVVKSDEKEFFLRFSACFGQFLFAHDATISYKNLPLKIYELTHYSFRREQSGELAGLKRLRAFSMPDMHTLCADFEQAKTEFERQYDLCAAWNTELGLPYETAFRAQEDFFNENKDWYVRMVKKGRKPMLLELYKERYAYFITKFEMNFVDNAAKASGLSTVQIDVENGETFDINYTDAEGKRQHPLILHCSVPGAIERVVYALLEQQAANIQTGKTPAFPTWLAPTQVRLVPITDAQNAAAEKILAQLKAAGVRADLDDRSDTLQKKVRDGEKEWAPFIAVLGEREAKDGTLSVRVRATGKSETLTPAVLAERVASECKGKPFEKLALSDRLSKRPILAA